MNEIGMPYDNDRRYATTISITTWDSWQRVDFHSTLLQTCTSIDSVRETGSSSFASGNRAVGKNDTQARPNGSENPGLIQVVG